VVMLTARVLNLAALAFTREQGLPVACLPACPIALAAATHAGAAHHRATAWPARQRTTQRQQRHAHNRLNSPPACRALLPCPVPVQWPCQQYCCYTSTGGACRQSA
jgi:hypothetical protein